MNTIRRALLPTLALMLCAAEALAQDTPLALLAARPALARDPAGPAELAQYDFLAGDWDVTVTIPRAGSEPQVYKAMWRNHWIAGGRVMMQQWSDPNGSGIELRSFNPVTRRWDGRNLYVPAPGTWYENEATLVASEMVVTTQARAADGAPIVRREIYRAIHANQFEIRTEVSRDAGASWKSGGYSLVATRVKR